MRSLFPLLFLFAAAPVFAEEAKPELTPFVTIKAAGSIRGAGIENGKPLTGYNPKGFFGFALEYDPQNIARQKPMIMLPISDFQKIEPKKIPFIGHIVEELKPKFKEEAPGKFVFDVSKDEEEKENIEIGFAAWEKVVALQKKDHLLLYPQKLENEIPAEPAKLFTDLDKYTAGYKIIFGNMPAEKITIGHLEFGWHVIHGFIWMGMLQNRENVRLSAEAVQKIKTECHSYTAGFTIDPPNGAILTAAVIPKKGTQTEKTFAEFKNRTTLFAGFRPPPAETVYAYNWSQKDFAAEANVLRWGLNQAELLFGVFTDGSYKIWSELGAGDVLRLAYFADKPVREFLNAELKKGTNDFAASFNTDGTVLFASATASKEDMNKLVEQCSSYVLPSKVNKKINGRDTLSMKEERKEFYTAVSGYKISSVKLTIEESIYYHDFGNEEDYRLFGSGNGFALKNVTLGLFVAEKEGGGTAWLRFIDERVLFGRLQ